METAMQRADLARSTFRKMSWRTLPLLMLAYLACYVDRANISIASLKMNHAIGIGESVYGVAAGIFFLGYLLCEVPSSLACHRYGPRLWIARIMITWGLLSALTAFVWNGPSFVTLRFLLGVAQAGFVPAAVLYVAQAFPDAYRGRVTGLFLMMVPISSVISSPVSAWLVSLPPVAGLQGWQLMFLVEAVPSVVLGLVLLRYMNDRPAEAQWLAPDERAYLQAEMHAENLGKREHNLMEALLDKKVLALGMVNFGVLITHQTVGLWLPQIMASFGWPKAEVGWLMAGIYALAALAMALWGRRSDKKRERKFHLLGALAVACTGLVVSTVVPGTYAKMLALTVSLVCSFASMSVVLTIPTQILKDRAAAGGVAMVMAIGSLSGFLGSSLVGALREMTGSFTAPILMIAGFGCVACATLARLEIGRPGSAEVDTPPLQSLPNGPIATSHKE
ncbi:MFS transporter [Paraburkholderia tropica]|uniref:MFS transporter n=1 Tax=Paraburkholderia tropica TaxID=92647 RepID=UPI002AB721BE|nr:MFS transporter [Paraburkholderia tropica]